MCPRKCPRRRSEQRGLAASFSDAGSVPLTPYRRYALAVPGGNGAVPARVQAVEVLALNVFGIADTSGRLITRRMVTERLSELAGHRGWL